MNVRDSAKALCLFDILIVGASRGEGKVMQETVSHHIFVGLVPPPPFQVMMERRKRDLSSDEIDTERNRHLGTAVKEASVTACRQLRLTEKPQDVWGPSPSSLPAATGPSGPFFVHPR